MPTSSFTIDPASARRFNDLINEMQKVTGAELQKVIRNAGRDVTKAAIKATPIAPTLANDKPVIGRGFAKAGWIKGLIDLGVTPLSQLHKKGGEHALELAETVIKLKGEQPYVEVANQVPYIEEVTGAIREVAIQETSKKMEERLTRMSRKLAGRWAR